MIGTRINNYEVLEPIGEGGMGTVYLARHPFIGRKAAVKVLHQELARDTNLVARFFNEARAANAIRHPNIIDIIDVGMLPGSETPYLMMELLEGESLASRVSRVGRLTVADAVDVAQQTASAVGAAHGAGIIHRDLKPENLFLVPHGSAPGRTLVKVLDFGIAKLRGEISGNHVRTETGALIGTPPYMSPEQCRGIGRDIDHRTDVYALGIILYEMLCGAPPFQGAGYGDVLVMHLMQAPEPPRAKNQDIPPALEAVILKALAKQVNDRFATMADLGTALTDAASNRVITLPQGSGSSPLPPSARAAPPAAAPAPADTPAAAPPTLVDAAAPATVLPAAAPATVPSAAAPVVVPRPATPRERPRETTTFSSTSGELASDLAAIGARPKRRLLTLGGAAALTAAVVTVLMWSARTPDPAPRPAAAPPAARVAAPPVATPAATPSPPPPTSKPQLPAAAAVPASPSPAALPTTPVVTTPARAIATPDAGAPGAPARRRVRPKPATGPEKW